MRLADLRASMATACVEKWVLTKSSFSVNAPSVGFRFSNAILNYLAPPKMSRAVPCFCLSSPGGAIARYVSRNDNNQHRWKEKELCSDPTK